MEEYDKVVAEYQENAAPSILLMSDSKPQTQKAAAKVVPSVMESKEKWSRNGERTASTAGPSNPSRPAAVSPKSNGRRVESAPVTSRPIRSPVSHAPNPRITPRKQSPKEEEKYDPKKTRGKAEIIKVVEDCQTNP